MSRRMGGAQRHDGSFPRVSGDEPVLMGTLRFLVVFSPRERG